MIRASTNSHKFPGNNALEKAKSTFPERKLPWKDLSFLNPLRVMLNDERPEGLYLTNFPTCLPVATLFSFLVIFYHISFLCLCSQTPRPQRKRTKAPPERRNLKKTRTVTMAEGEATLTRTTHRAQRFPVCSATVHFCHTCRVTCTTSSFKIHGSVLSSWDLSASHMGGCCWRGPTHNLATYIYYYKSRTHFCCVVSHPCAVVFVDLPVFPSMNGKHLKF